MDFRKVIEAAKNSTTDKSTLNRLDDIVCYPGWANSSEEKIIIVSNWNNVQERDPNWGIIKFWRNKNNIMVRLRRIFETYFKDTVEIHWDDEVTSCDYCGKAINQTPSHRWWKPDFTVHNDGSVICHKCKPPKKKFNVTMSVVVHLTVESENKDSVKDIVMKELESFPNNMKYEISSSEDWEVEENLIDD